MGIPLFSHCQSEYTHMWKKNNDGQSLPRWGRLRNEDTAIPETQPSPRETGRGIHFSFTNFHLSMI